MTNFGNLDRHLADKNLKISGRLVLLVRMEKGTAPKRQGINRQGSS
jgi:hypothetical protein